MKLLNIILLASILIFSSCSKDEDSSPSISNNDTNTNTETTDGYKGSYTLSVDGNTYTHLQNDISLVNQTLQIPGLDNNGEGFVFESSGSVGEIGETRDICLDEATCDPVIATSLMRAANNFYATSGSITRVSEYVVEFNLIEDLGIGVRTLTATVNVGTVVTI